MPKPSSFSPFSFQKFKDLFVRTGRNMTSLYEFSNIYLIF